MADLIGNILVGYAAAAWASGFRAEDRNMISMLINVSDDDLDVICGLLRDWERMRRLFVMNDNVTFTKCPCCGGQITTIECERSGNQVVISGDKVVSKFLWISCSDRMPQLYQRVLVCIENETVTVGYLCGDEWCITEKGCMHKYRYKDFNITHWMQLPEQPEGGEQNEAD